jgi:hypothetical protein
MLLCVNKGMLGHYPLIKTVGLNQYWIKVTDTHWIEIAKDGIFLPNGMQAEGSDWQVEKGLMFIKVIE